MLFTSLVEAALKSSLDKAEAIEPPESAERARVVVDYYESTKKQQDHLTVEHDGLHEKKEKWLACPKVCYNIVAAVAKTLCTLYTDPVVYRWDDSKDGKRAAELFGRIKGWASIMRDVDTFTFLAALIAVRPVWQDKEDDPLKMALYHPDQITYTMDPLDMTVAQEVMFSWMMGQGDAATECHHVWSDDKFIEVVDDEVQTPDESESPGRAGFANPYKVKPIVFFRNETPRWNFWGEPATDLVIGNLALNGQATMLNLIALKQGFSTLLTIGAPEGWKPTVGIDSYVNVTNASGSTGAGASYLQPNANIEGVINAVNTCLSMFFASRRIPETAIIAKQVGDSGVSLVAQAAALVDYRQERIATMRPLEQELIRMTLKVMEFHETGNLVDFPAPQITYTEKKKALSTEERDEWDWRISHGVASEFDLFRALNPGMTDKDSEKAYTDNLKKSKGLALGAAVEARKDVRAAVDDKGGVPPSAGEPVEDVAKTAMNGAQVQALQTVVQAVAAKQLPAEAARQLILMAFPNLDPAMVGAMIDSVEDAAEDGPDTDEGDGQGEEEENAPPVSEGQGDGMGEEVEDEDEVED